MSSTVSSRRPAAKGNIKTGICENHNYTNPDTGETGDCPKCASGERQSVNVQRLSDFRCQVCGGKLTPVKTSLPMSKIFMGLAGVAVIAVILLFVFKPWGGESEVDNTPVSAYQPVNPPAQKEPAHNEAETSVKKESEEGKTNVAEAKDAKKTVTDRVADTANTAAKSSSRSVLGGAAVLVKESSGYTTIRFKRSYNLDLGKTDGSTLSVGPGDEIYMANVRNGFHYSGQYKSSSGEETQISGLKVRL